MEDRTLERALDIYSALVTGNDISLKNKETAELYNAFYADSDVYDMVTKLLARQGLHLYEYNDGLFVTAGSGNRIFGYTNDDLKRQMGLRLNAELYLVYFIIYEILSFFYKTSDTYQVRDYVRLDEIITNVNEAAKRILGSNALSESVSDTSFSAVAALWEGLPPFLSEDRDRNKASRGSRFGITKVAFNFLVSEKLFTAVDERYYPSDRFHAIAENYFEENVSLIQDFLGEDN